MIRKIAPISLGLLAVILTALVFSLPTPKKEKLTEVNPSSELLVKNVQIFHDGNKLGDPVTIFIKDGLIKKVSRDTNENHITVIDGTGLTALPGLIDSHTHTYGSSREDALRFGVTTMLDMFTDPRLLPDALNERSDRAATNKADLFSAGMMATAPGGHGTQFGIPMETLTTPEQAGDFVAARKAEGSDYIKLVYMPGIKRFPSIDRATAKAVIDAGHAAGLMVVAHISTHDAAADMISDGIDGLVHVFADRVVTNALLEEARSKGIFIIPTLSVIAGIDGDQSAAELAAACGDLLSPMQLQTVNSSFGRNVPGFKLDIALKNVKLFHDAGITILAGSDAPNPATAHGLSLHNEMRLLVRAGMNPMEALAAASSEPARVFGLKNRGILKVGARADLILIDGDPTKDINATISIRKILKNGIVVDRSLKTPSKGAALQATLFGDFETDLSSIEGFEWSSTTDLIAGGKSIATLFRVGGGARGSTHSLKIEASVVSGFAFPWAGAQVALSQTGSVPPADVTEFSSLSFDIKGTPGDFRIMAFDARAGGLPPTQLVTIDEEWQAVTLKLSDFPSLQLEQLTGIAFVAGPALGDSTIYLDNVRLVE